MKFFLILPMPVIAEKGIMLQLAIITQHDEILSAIQEYIIFEELEISLHRIAQISDLANLESCAGIVLSGESSNRKAFEQVRQIRDGQIYAYIPILLFLPAPDPYSRTICLDLEYVMPCSWPLQSHDFLPSLKKVVLFAKKRQHAMQLRSQIAQFMREQKFSEALPIIEEYAKETKDPFREHLLKAKVYFALNQHKQAIEKILAAIHENKSSFEARLTLANIYLAAQNQTKAIEVLNKSIAVAPKYYRFLTRLGEIYLEQGQYGLAAEKFQASLKIDEFQEDSLASLISAEILSGKMIEAREVVRHLINPLVIASYVHLNALFISKSGRHDDAKKLMDTIIKLIPQQKDLYKVWMNLGIQAKKDHKIDKAIMFFREALASAPKGYKKAEEQLKSLKAS